MLILLCYLAGFLGMEWVAWAAHRYLMHGPLWFVHRDHHEPQAGFFQRNDLFFLLFAIPGWFSIMLGLQNQIYGLAAIGFGISTYGLTYVFIHELLVHRRLSVFPIPRAGYWSQVVKAHRVHHATKTQHDCENFGLLWLPAHTRFKGRPRT